MTKQKAALVSFVALVGTFVLIQWIPSRSNVRVVENRLRELPLKIAGYVGQDIAMDKGVVRELNTDGYVFRNYVNQNGQIITLYIGYYGTQKGGRTGHNPNACYPSQGWAILQSRRVELDVPVGANSKAITINEMVVKAGTNEEIVYHWYQSNGSDVLGSGVQANLHRFKSMLLHGRNDGAFIRVSSPVVESRKGTRRMLKDFIAALYPLLIKDWPKES